MEKILITGGKGFIGSHLVDSLINEYEVYILDNSFPGFGVYRHPMLGNTKIPKEYVNPLVNQIAGDVRNYDHVDFATKNMDYVIHLAALSHVGSCLRDPKLCMDINVGGTINILEACRKNDVKRVIVAASDHIYGKNPDFLPIDESHSMKALYESDPYGVSKAMQASISQMYHKQYGLPVVVTASGNVFGKRQSKPNVIPNFIDAINNNHNLVIHGDGMQTRDFYHISNLCDAYKLCITTKDIDGELFNFGSGQETNINQIAEALLKLYPQSKSKIIHINDTKLNAMNRMCLDITKARELLNWAPRVSLEEGLKLTIEE